MASPDKWERLRPLQLDTLRVSEAPMINLNVYNDAQHVKSKFLRFMCEN